MTKEESIETLQRLFLNSKYKVESSLIDILKEKPWEFDRFSGTDLLFAHESCALYYTFLENKFAAAKQEFYTCGSLTSYRVLRFGFWDENKPTGTDHPSTLVSVMAFKTNFSYLLLSDSTELIGQYSLLSHSWMEQQVKEGFMLRPRAIQCVLLEDWKELERIMPYFDKQIKKRKSDQLDKDFFVAMMENKEEKVSEVLRLMVTPKYHNANNGHDPFKKNFISFPAVGYTKLAWLKGMKVQVDSPYIPMELMPVAPLAHYENPYQHLWRLGEE